MVARNAANTADIPLIATDASNNATFGTTSVNIANTTLSANTTVTVSNSTTSMALTGGTFVFAPAPVIQLGATGVSAATGSVRLSNGMTFSYRNNANTGDLVAMQLAGATDTLSIGNNTTVLVLTGNQAGGNGVQIVSSGGTSNIIMSVGGTTQYTGTFNLNTFLNPVASGTNPAASGQLRIPNATSLVARNAANTADLPLLGTDASNNINVGVGPVIFAAGVTVALSQAQNIAGAGNAWSVTAQTGRSAAATAGSNGGPMTLTAGAGGAGQGVNQPGGAGANATFAAGAGGLATGISNNSNGGNVILNSGAAGTGGAGTAGTIGTIVFQSGGVQVGSWIPGTTTGASLDWTGAATGSQAVSAANHGRIFYNSTLQHFYFSENGGAYAQFGGAAITQLTGDVTAGPGSGSVAATVVRINGATVPASGALTTGNVLQVTGVSALSYAAVNLGGGANFVTGTLPAANQAAQTMAGDVTGTTAASVVSAISGVSPVAVSTNLAFGTNPAGTGRLRFPNADALVWRNGTNTADIAGYTVNGSNQMQIGTTGGSNSVILVPTDGTDTQIYVGLALYDTTTGFSYAQIEGSSGSTASFMAHAGAGSSVTSLNFQYSAGSLATNAGNIFITSQSTSSGIGNGGSITLNTGSGVVTNGTIIFEQASTEVARFTGSTTLQFAAAVSTPTINQLIAQSDTATFPLTIKGQNAFVTAVTNTTGGTLVLKGGAGSTTTTPDGNVLIGSLNALTVFTGGNGFSTFHITGNTTLQTNNNGYCRLWMTATATITLPAPGNNQEWILVVDTTVGAAAITVTIAPHGAEKINGTAASMVFIVPVGSVMGYRISTPDNSNWTVT